METPDLDWKKQIIEMCIRDRIAGSLTLFIMFRIIHGVSFGMVTVGGNTVVIDIRPSSRRGEGLGYYGLTNNTAMSIGPMFGLFLHDAGVSFATIFCYAFGACTVSYTHLDVYERQF